MPQPREGGEEQHMRPASEPWRRSWSLTLDHLDSWNAGSNKHHARVVTHPAVPPVLTSPSQEASLARM